MSTTYKKNRLRVWLAVCLTVLLLTAAMFFLLYPFPSNEKAPLFTQEHPLIYNNDVYESEAFIEQGDVYVPFLFLKDQINDGIFYDEAAESVIAATKNKVLQYPYKSLQYYVNEQPFSVESPIVRSKDGQIYVAAKSFEALYGFQAFYKEDTGAVIIRKDGEKVLTGIVEEASKHDRRLRTEPTRTSPYRLELQQDESLTIQEENGAYYSVLTSGGVHGYLPKKSVQSGKAKTFTMKTEQQPDLPEVKQPIHMTWEAVYSKNPDPKNLPKMPGVNVVSPTWFALASSDGKVSNKASMAYVKWAKQHEHQIWALFSNDFNPDLTHQVLSSFESRQKVIRQLLEYSSTYKLDGINVDFENVNVEDGPLVTQFMRELSARMHEAGKIVSMDITFISGSGNWSMFYEREKLAEIVDYLVVMAYDEHWGTSPVSGSVASLPWVENNLQRLLKVVPNERLILGVPLFTRIWKETETPNGNIEVSSKAYSMEEVQKWLKEKDVEVTYDEASGQRYGEYTNEKERTTYKVWIEDAYSLQKRGQLVLDYELAGAASWSRSFADDTAWKALSSSMQKPASAKE